jgi:hypothetical protein
MARDAMQCEEVITRLSEYFDDELPGNLRKAVDEHLAQCAACSERLAALRAVARAAKAVVHPGPPADLTDRVLQAVLLEQAPQPDLSARTARRRLHTRRVAVWGGLFAAAAMIGIVLWNVLPHDDHEHAAMVEAFDEFLTAYAAGSRDAPSGLLARFGGERVDAAGAGRVLKRPTLAPTALGQHRLAARYAIKMPCCDCVQTVYSVGDQPSLVVFEHEKEQVDWFGSRPRIRAACGQRSCCLIELPGSLAASWQTNGHFVTVVGIKDVAELTTLIDALQPS